MIPTRLELHNFGAIDAADVDLSTVNLAAVVGPNGSGKSTTFTIAPIWALFGGTKNGCSADNMVRLGTSDASVTLEFEHHGGFYRVLRTRSLNGRGKSSLELQKQEDGSWTPISGTTIRETEEKIRDLLGLDEETFTSSSMILQGRSNEFTAKAPGQRKQILAQILGLGIYETLQEGAKRHVQELDARLRTNRERLEAIGSILAGKSDLKAQLETTEAQIQAKTLDVADCETSLRDAETRLIQAKETQTRVEALVVRAKDLDCRIATASEARDSLLCERERLEALVAAEAEIAAKVQELVEAESLLTSMEPLEARREALRQEYASCDHERKTHRKASEEALVRLSAIRQDLSMASRYRDAAEQLPALKAELEEQACRREDVLTLEAEAKSLDVRLRDRVHALDQSRLHLEFEIRNCEAQVAKLADAHCVDLEAARTHPCAFLRAAMEAAERLPGLTAEIDGLADPEITVLQKKFSQLHDEIGCVHYDADRAEVLKRRIQALEPMAAAAAALESKQEMVTILEGQIEAAGGHGSRCEQRLEEIRQEGKELSKRLEELPNLKAEIERLQQWRPRKEQLPAKKERLSWVKEQAQALDAEVMRMEEETRLLEEAIKIEELKLWGEDPREIESEATKMRHELSGLRNDLQKLHSALGAARARLEELAHAESERTALNVEREPLAVELSQYQALAKAFGRDGIPALIIENAVPELERTSNEILGEMSQGRHSLRFETQRELKSRSGMAETLDIIVSDWQGERPYETFSGGEQLRIDYAIRFALAELLAHRAGSRIEWLVIDEGLGSQDRAHRDLVLEAIRNVANRFRKVLVITHVEEAQGAFPQQIRFERVDDRVEVLVS
ncbi:AAA family ATPase [Aminirod propionatiphilus]|uniref:SMC family ATPase n=1 Tax=Aminirod propionatiphilus TaxID=3415223 RepID=A0ACD1DYD5_9BACT|nr:SMC family ATPase [Synergistota bacterium]